MALLPLAGWAQVDISDGWSIKFTPESPVTFTGADQTPTVSLAKTGQADLTTGFNVQWSATSIINAGSYTVTVTADNTNTYDDLASPTKKFWILKANAQLSNVPALVADFDYDGDSHSLIATAPTFNLNSNPSFAGISAKYSLDGTDWSTEIPSAKKPGTYYVYYKVEGTDNYNGIVSTLLGSVTISGSALVENTDYTAPTALSADIDFDNENHALLTSGGSVAANKGTMKYSLDGTNWDTAVTTAKDVNTYTIYWKIEAAEGYYDVDGSKSAKIVAVAPNVTAATGASGLVWDGEPKALLSAAGSADLGATPKYQIKAPGETSFAAAVAFADVKGTAAGSYEIKTVVPAGGNYNYAEASATITVTIAGKAAFTSAPTAASVTWNGTAQQLIEAGAGTVEGKVKYKLVTNSTTTVDWTTTIDLIKATAATKTDNVYHVYYKVDADNYETVSETEIENVKINKRPLSVKVNDVTKTYDGNATLGAATVDGGLEKFTFITPLDGYKDFSTLPYATITATSAKNAGEHADVVTVTKTALEAIYPDYDYTIIPGKLTVNKKEIYVEAMDQTALTVTLDGAKTFNLGNKYDVKNLVSGEGASAAFSTLPVLKSNAPNPIVVGNYDLSWTEGTLKTNGNYKLRAENPYVIADGVKFVVTPNASSRVVITVLPKSKSYGESDPDYTKFEAGVDYYVSNLLAGDEIESITFERASGENVADGPYALTATATLKHPDWYAEPISYNNSTFTINPVELTATVDQQTVSVGATVDDLDPNAWSVTGLVNNEDKSVLGGTLSLTGSTADAGLVDDAITLAITNTNYTLKAGTETGDLLVIGTTDFALNPADGDLVSKLDVADGSDYKIVFTNMTMKEKEWYAIVLPFATTPAELVKALGQYVVCNHLDTENSTDQVFRFKLEMDELPAGVPFLIKPAKNLDWADFNLGTVGSAPVKKTIEKDITPVTAQYQSKKLVTFTGTYATNEVLGVPDKPSESTATICDRVWWLSDTSYGSTPLNDWRKPKNNAHPLKAMEAYLIAGEGWTTYTPNFTVEDFDGQTTSIKTLGAESIHNMLTEGWYTLNGVKLQSAPTQKGVYINNGKKVVIR